MKFINEHEFLSLLILTVLVIGAIFYWYELRPRNISKGCSLEAMKEAYTLLKGVDPEAYNLEYILCTRKRGL